MTDREKLMELFDEAHKICDSINCVYDGNACKYDGLGYCFEDFLADQLISKGVTIPVRCGECRYKYEPVKCSLWIATEGDKVAFRYHGDDFYCPYGERKEDD